MPNEKKINKLPAEVVVGIILLTKKNKNELILALEFKHAKSLPSTWTTIWLCFIKKPWGLRTLASLMNAR